MVNNLHIPKKLYLIWLGDNIPSYAYFSLNAYRYANQDFLVQLISFSINQIKVIYNGHIINSIEQVLYNAIDVMLKDSKQYLSLLQKQLAFYGKSILALQLLSDIFRVMLLEKYGGIYVDCDTFPIKPFDTALLDTTKFVVAKHYEYCYTNNNVGEDNYFFGSIQNASNIKSIQLLQTNDKWWTDVQYLLRKQKFFKLALKYVPNIKSNFYIEHFCSNSYKRKNIQCINPQYCFLDTLLAKKYNII